MGNWERNLVIFGVAGMLSIAGILFGGVIGGMMWTFLVLAVAMFLALGRFGPDHATLEEWLARRWRYARSVKRYTYIRPGEQPMAQARPVAQSAPPPPAVRPVTLADDPGAYYGAVAVLLLVAGVVFVNWLHTGGDAELARFLQHLLRR